MTGELEADILDAPGYDDPFPEVDASQVKRVREQLREETDAIAAREQYLGTTGTATIIDADIGGSYVHFDVLLPDQTVGEIRFTNPEFSDAPVYDFLEFVGGDRDDPFSVLYEDVPATYSEWKGWRVPIRGNTALGAYTGEGRAATWFDIDEKTGGVMASESVRAGYRLLALASGVAASVTIASGSLEGAGVALLVTSAVVWGWMAYLFAAASGMSQPKLASVTSPDDD